MYFFVFVIFYVSEACLDKFQDKHDQAKGLEGKINSVVMKFRKSSILYTNVCKMLIFVQFWPDMRLHNVEYVVMEIFNGIFTSSVLFGLFFPNPREHFVYYNPLQIKSWERGARADILP